jgi:hypothetical protein
MSKFLLNLLVQISKAFVYSKIKFYSKSLCKFPKPPELKNNSKKVPSLRKILKNSPETSKFHIV